MPSVNNGRKQALSHKLDGQAADNLVVESPLAVWSATEHEHPEAPQHSATIGRIHPRALVPPTETAVANHDALDNIAKLTADFVVCVRIAPRSSCESLAHVP